MNIPDSSRYTSQRQDARQRRQETQGFGTPQPEAASDPEKEGFLGKALFVGGILLLWRLLR